MALGYERVLSPVECHQPGAFPPTFPKVKESVVCLSDLSPPRLWGEMQASLSLWIKYGPSAQLAHMS